METDVPLDPSRRVDGIIFGPGPAPYEHAGAEFTSIAKEYPLCVLDDVIRSRIELETARRDHRPDPEVFSWNFVSKNLILGP